MNILQINKYHFIKGGADSVFFNTMRLLADQGHRVVPFCIHHPENKPSGYSRYFVDAPEIRDIEGTWGKLKSIPRFVINNDAARKLDQLLSRETFDVAHIHNLFNGISLSILPVLKKHGIPVVITMHDTRFICPSSYFNLRGKWCESCAKTFFANCALRRCYQDNLPNSIMSAFEMFHKEYAFPYDEYICQYIFVSQRYRQLHALRHNYFEKKGEVLYNFLPGMTHLQPSSGKGEYLFCYGRITPEKGMATLVEVMRQFPNTVLKVAGTGILLEKLREIAPPNVHFLGFVSGESLFELIKGASFIVVPSEWEENNPLTIIEAYACGKPVIGSRIGGIPEIIEEEDTGFVFDAFDPRSMSEVIARAMQVSTSEYERLSQRARNFAEQHFDEQQHYQRLLTIYNRAIVTYENI